MKFLKFLLLLIVAFMLFVACIAANRFVLVANEKIFVDAYPNPDPTKFPSVGVLLPKTKAAVISCDDLKSYMAIRVRLDSGKEGYVIAGNFSFEAVPFWSRTDVPVSFSCPPVGY